MLLMQQIKSQLAKFGLTRLVPPGAKSIRELLEALWATGLLTVTHIQYYELVDSLPDKITNPHVNVAMDVYETFRFNTVEQCLHKELGSKTSNSMLVVRVLLLKFCNVMCV